MLLLLEPLDAARQHANIRTPRWLGYLIQRPESHGVHYGRGIHRCNYSDLARQETPVAAGFYRGAAARPRRDARVPPAVMLFGVAIIAALWRPERRC
jgi:hypothetical protein